MMRVSLFQPDIPQNAGAIMRLCACLGVPLDIIEPCGFVLDDRRVRRAGMDYIELLETVRHPSWAAFLASRSAGRLVLVTTRAELSYISARFTPHDTLLFGRESAGVPDEVHAAADLRVTIPMRPGARSLNVATAAAMVLGEALRQLELFPRGA